MHDPKNTTLEWKRQVSPFGKENYVLDGGPEFYVSFQPTPGSLSGFPFLSDFFAGDAGDAVPETALCVRYPSGHKFHILNGDFRKDYEGLVPQGLAACLAFYESQRAEYRSTWSTDDAERAK